MFAVGDYIVYRSAGMCRVDGIGHPQAAADVNREYYELHPVRGTGVIYIPVDSSVYMRPVMTKKEAEALFFGCEEIQADCCGSRDHRLQCEHYREVLRQHSSEQLLGMIKSLLVKEEQLGKKGKKLAGTDQEFKRKAEELLYGEISFVMGFPYEKVAGDFGKKLLTPISVQN